MPTAGRDNKRGGQQDVEKTKHTYIPTITTRIAGPLSSPFRSINTVTLTAFCIARRFEFERIQIKLFGSVGLSKPVARAAAVRACTRAGKRARATRGRQAASNSSQGDGGWAGGGLLREINNAQTAGTMLLHSDIATEAESGTRHDK